ncbi:MAG: LysR substrate-binding domain-containing protein [Aquabacterium sp.]|nr:LysR substrate-binding domain-containing protein [Aquabacterium sp.]
MRRAIPSTATLIAFDAAARHESFTRAAAELALTQSAVCRQVAALEAQLGVALFERTRRGVRLSQAGQAYARKVAQRLAELERDALAVMAGEGSGAVIELAVVPTFGTRWLLPRLPDFQRRHPGVQVHLHTRTRPFLFEGSGLDAAIYAGDGHWPGAQTRLILPETLVAVCSPRLLPGGRMGDAAALARLPLLQQTTRPYAWRRWFEQAGVQTDADVQGPRFEQFSMSIQAAVQGMGAALVPEIFVAEELADGRLVQAAPARLQSELAYYLAVPERRAEPVAVRQLAAWLASDAATSS